MTSGALVALAVGATALLLVGARLLEQPTPVSLTLGVLAVTAGTALAATAVAGAWRSPRPDREDATASETRSLR